MEFGLTSIFATIILWVLIVLGIGFVIVFIWDVFQKEHAILRNYPLIGHIRYISEFLGVYLRAYFYARDREELPFNREERTWVYRASKNVDTTIGFGSTRDISPVGTILFIDAPFPVLSSDIAASPAVAIGPDCEIPYVAHSIFNISGMSYGSISKNAVLALSHGAKKANCWLNTGEGGVSSYHLSSGCDIVAQIGTAKFGFCDEQGHLSDERLKLIAHYPQVKMFEIKLSQGAKPGRGGILPAAKVTPEIAEARNIKPYTDSISPNRHPDIGNVSELLDAIHHIRKTTGKPVGFKMVLGSYDWLNDLFQEILKRGAKSAPDFITLDGSEGGTGAAPESLVDYMGLPLKESLPVLVDTVIAYGLRERIKIIASGKLIMPSQVAWALCIGADFITSARGFAFAMGCIQALRCHTNTCPTGITSHGWWLTRGLDPTLKSERVANYIKSLVYEVGVISHSCGVADARDLKRHHARMVTECGLSVPISEMYPEPKAGIKGTP